MHPVRMLRLPVSKMLDGDDYTGGPAPEVSFSVLHMPHLVEQLEKVGFPILPAISHLQGISTGPRISTFCRLNRAFPDEQYDKYDWSVTVLASEAKSTPSSACRGFMTDIAETGHKAAGGQGT